ncbi:MAG: hypothetical protein E6R08_03525 [Nevskiaceae bacterium]|nr:MAG: hypothetical protein E6R08_03525 [Nevskiaceae bacterium]
MKKPTPAFYVPKGLKPPPGWAAKALRIAPYWFFLETAIDMLPDIFPLRSPGGPDGIPLAPNIGWWKKTHGYYTNQSGSYPVRANNIYQSLTNYQGPITGQSISVQGAIQIAPASHWTVCGWWRKKSGGVAVRYANYARFVRVAGPMGASDVGWWPATPYPTAPVPPLSGMPPPFPKPPPFRLLPHRGNNPGLSPFQQRDAGPRPAAAAPPRRGGYPTVVLGGGPPMIKPPPVSGLSPKPSPPAAGVKESKPGHIYTNPAIRIPLQVVGLTSEFGDFVKSLWDALPPEEQYGKYKLHYRDKKTGQIKTYWKQRKTPLIRDMLRDLYRNWDNPNFDTAKAVQNVWNERAQDRYYGHLGKGLKKHVYDKDWYNLPVGLQFGPWL